MTNQPLILARDVGLRFDRTSLVLEHVNVAVDAGSFVSLVGPSGCGKSTFLRLVAGLRVPTSGELYLAGRATQQSDLKRAFVFQDPSLLPWRTATANVRLPLELDWNARERDRAKTDGRIADALRLTGLNEADFRKRPRQLSGGMRMRVSLARALVTNPQLMLLDEPFAALDDILRQQLNEELQRIWAAARWTALFVTHNVSEAVFLSQRVLVMSRRPGTIISEIVVPFAYPRAPELRGDPEFARLMAEVSQHLRQAAGAAQ